VRVRGENARRRIGSNVSQAGLIQAIVRWSSVLNLALNAIARCPRAGRCGLVNSAENKRPESM